MTAHLQSWQLPKLLMEAQQAGFPPFGQVNETAVAAKRRIEARMVDDFILTAVDGD